MDIHQDNGIFEFHSEGYSITQFTTGSDRAIKAHVRRAFCRLVIEEMHRQCIEVDLTVS
jgi:hypothetical protein